MNFLKVIQIHVRGFQFSEMFFCIFCFYIYLCVYLKFQYKLWTFYSLQPLIAISWEILWLFLEEKDNKYHLLIHIIIHKLTKANMNPRNTMLTCHTHCESGTVRITSKQLVDKYIPPILTHILHSRISQ